MLSFVIPAEVQQKLTVTQDVLKPLVYHSVRFTTGVPRPQTPARNPAALDRIEASPECIIQTFR